MQIIYKFQYIVFGIKEGTDSFIVNRCEIKPVNNVKILGLHLGNELKFDEHVTNVWPKAGKQISVMQIKSCP